MTLPLNTIVCGDCLDVMRQWPDACVDCVLTDPPYSRNTVTAHTRQMVRNLSDLSIQEFFYREFFRDVARILRPGSLVFSFCDDTFYPILFASSYNFLQGHGLITWDKQHISFGNPIRKRHELIMYASCGGGGTFYPSERRRHFPSVLDYERERVKEHDAQKPLPLMEDLISHFTAPGSLILDPFAGSGTTCVAAQSLSRQYIGIEREPEYCDIARARLRHHTAQAPLFTEAA